MIVLDQPGTKLRSLLVLTTTDAIIELGCHIEILVTCAVVHFVEGTVVSDDVGDVTVLSVAELGIAIARRATGRRRGL